MKCRLLLSREQAAVERRYSVNKDLLIENLKERTLVVLHLFQDVMAVYEIDEALPKYLIQHTKDTKDVVCAEWKDQTADKKTRKDTHHEMAIIKARQDKLAFREE